MNKKYSAMCVALLFFFGDSILVSQSLKKPLPRQLIVKLKSESIPAAPLQKEDDRRSYVQSVAGPLHDKTFVSALKIPDKNTLSKATARASARFRDLFIVTLPSDANQEKLGAVLQSYRNDPHVEYASINHIFQYDDFMPNDTYRDSLYWIKLLQASKAWDTQQGSRSVIIGIIDSGIDYNHPDLMNQLWENPGEQGLDDLGRDKRFNGVDDDGNGFVDDWRGWDFAGSQELNDGSISRSQDNDPFDENGHGTAVAGIVAAQGNNHLGVIGLAFGSTMMNLRAGGASGFLQEDNIAQAIIYAVDNGAKVLNMSFGDVEYSPFLKDAIRYAYENNVVIVGSAGNSSSAAYHYPSSFDEVLSVSATDAEDFIAPFSNYGASIRVAAPGVNLYTTASGGGYQFFSGTSASAPLVSALAALILSQNSGFTNDEVRSVIESSSDDIGEKGWEPYYGAGRINAWRALQVTQASVAQIDFPATDFGTSANQITIRGTASGALLKTFSVFYGVGSNPQDWILITSANDRQAVSDSIGFLDLQPLSEGAYTVRLLLENKDGSLVEDRSRFFLDRTAPQISNVKIEKMIAANSYGYFIKWSTDDLCAAALYYRPQSSAQNYIPMPVSTQSKNHVTFIFENDLRGHFEFYIEARNTAGLITTDNNQNSLYTMNLADADIPANTLVQDTSVSLPLFYLMSKATDLNQNGKKELIVNTLQTNHDFSKVKIYEYNNAFPGKFQPIQSYAFNGVPRDAIEGGITGPSKLLIGAGASSFVLENIKADTVPTLKVFSDSNDFWGSRFDDLFKDGHLKMIAKHGLQYQILNNLPNGSWSKIADLANPTAGDNVISIPGSAVGDFDHDGQKEIVLGDLDGDIYIYEAQGQTFVNTWSYALPNRDASGFIASGDFDGDGNDEFIAGCHTPDITSESDAADQYWTFTVFKATGNNTYQPVWQQSIYGYQSLTDFRSGVSAGDLYHDGKQEIFLSLYPNLYVIRYDNGIYQPVWFHAQARSNAVVVSDFNNDGVGEIYFNDGQHTRSFKPNSAGPSVQPPAAFRAIPLDTNQIGLSWQPDLSLDYYKVYRGTNDTNLIFFCNVTALQKDTVDFNVVQNQTYVYAMSSVKNNIESEITALQEARPNRKPFVTGARVLDGSQIRVSFSENMNRDRLEQISSYFINALGHPTSAIPAGFGRDVILTWPDLPPGIHWVQIADVADTDGTPIDTARNSVAFTVIPPAKTFYILKNEYLGHNQIDLVFSQPLEKNSAETPGNYSVEPEFQVMEARLDTADAARVRLKVQGPHPIGALGFQYIISVKNLKSLTGALIDETNGNKSAIVISKTDLSNIFVYPDPYRSDESSTLTFANLTPSAKIKIYALNGKFINEIEESNQDGGVTWDLRDRQGNKIVSGIYVYIVTSGSLKKYGKFSVVR